MHTALCDGEIKICCAPIEGMVGHATIGSDRRGSSQSTAGTFKFPDFTTPSEEDDTFEVISRGPSPKPLPNGLPPGLHSSARWPYRKQSQPWINGTAGGSRHGRQKSLSEAIQTVRTRKMSMTETAQEITESLKAPVSIRLVVCTNQVIGWQVLRRFRYYALPGIRLPSSRTLLPRRS